MTKDQLDAALASTAKDANTSGQTFYIPSVFLRFLRTTILLAVRVVPGVPAQPAPTSFGAPMGLFNFVSLLNYPANDFKLFLSTPAMFLLTRLIARSVRRMDGSLFTYDDNGHPIP